MSTKEGGTQSPIIEGYDDLVAWIAAAPSRATIMGRRFWRM